MTVAAFSALTTSSAEQRWYRFCTNWAGKPEVTGSSKFSDVADGAWYAKPVIWAAENGVVNGVGNGKFAPNDPVTREQLVAMLYRYAEKPEVSNALTDFADANKISDYASMQ